MNQTIATRELVILRHAKSSWDSDAATDFERPLNKRGRKEATRMGRWLHDEGVFPDLIIASPAERAKATILGAADPLEVDPATIRWEQRVYEASASTLLEVLREVPDDIRRVMLVGHNPGLENLALYLLDKDAELVEGFLKTATVVRIAMPDHWVDVAQNCGKLIQLQRAKELGEE